MARFSLVDSRVIVRPGHVLMAGAVAAGQSGHCLPRPNMNADAGMFGHLVRSKCTYLAKMGDIEGQVLPCTHWSFNKTSYDNTLTSEFELVCDYDFLRPTYSSVYFFSACLAAPLSGWLSDRYGCKTMMSIGIVTYIILGNSLNWLPNISRTILVLHFMMGLMHPTSTQTSYTLAMEICEPRLRSVVGIMVYLPWTLALVWWGGIAYLIRDWR
nr:beta-alanine transporter-like [Cherax quadricarinatus]